MKLAEALLLQAAAEVSSRHPARFQTVALDFDGVLAHVANPFQWGQIGPPKQEGLKFLGMLIKEGFHVVIFTARKETDIVAKWLGEQGFPSLLVTNSKPIAIAYFDDRAFRVLENSKAVDMMKLVRKAVRS